MIRTPLLLALLLATSASGIALAADTPAAPAQRLAKLDTNGDGVIDRSEAAVNPRLAAKFDQLDKNKDGKLSRDELPRWQHGRRGHGDHAASAAVHRAKACHPCSCPAGRTSRPDAG